MRIPEIPLSKVNLLPMSQVPIHGTEYTLFLCSKVCDRLILMACQCVQGYFILKGLGTMFNVYST